MDAQREGDVSSKAVTTHHMHTWKYVIANIKVLL